MAENVISVGDTENKHFLHVGFSASITSSYTAPDTNPKGITWDDTNVISAGNTANKHYLHSGFSSSITSSYTAPDTRPDDFCSDG